MKRKLILWYHTHMMEKYGKLADSVNLDPEFTNIKIYEQYRQKHIHHKKLVKSLKLGELQEGA